MRSRILKRFCAVAAISALAYCAHLLYEFRVSLTATEELCSSFHRGATKADVLEISGSRAFEYSEIGGFIYSKKSYGRAVCVVEFDKDDVLISRRYSFLD